MLHRALLLFGTVLAGVLGAGIGPHHSAASVHGDISIVKAASGRLGHQSRGAVIRWLHSRPDVAQVALGGDGRTIGIRFRDGIRGAILPRDAGWVKVSPRSLRSHVAPMARPTQQSAGRAIVLEPFATELGLGPNAGDVETQDLQKAGFQVRQAYDMQVNISMMLTLPQYNVSYMHTHSGTAFGQVLVAIGEPADTPDPLAGPYMADGSVQITGVSGAPGQSYLAITTSFVTQHLSRFPTDSFLFINGCQLRGTSFWSALSAKGAGALISWDHEATTQDGYLAAAGVFYYLDQGQSISQAVQSTFAAGYGMSQPPLSPKATMGYEGDGSITLARAAAGGSSPATTPTPTSIPPPPATSTPIPTSLPTATPTVTPVPPTATATTVPLHPSLSLLSRVNPGQQQTAQIRQFPSNAGIRLAVTFPNGDTLTQAGKTDGAGSATLTFVQPASKITRESSTATVTAQTAAAARQRGAAPTAATGSYAIGFGKLDVSVEPRQQQAGKKLAIWVHAHARKWVRIGVRLPKKRVFNRRTGPRGWVLETITVPPRLKAGRTVRVVARATVQGQPKSTSSTFTVR